MPVTSNQDSTPNEVPTSTASFLNNRGKRIFCKYWEPAQKPRALVYIAHGFGEHCLPYDSLAKTLASKNFYVFSHDHVGHGQSGGSRVHIETFDHYVQDVLQHVDLMKEKFTSLPVFLFGHSMGGAICILTALKRPEDFSGVVLSGPAIAANPEVATPFKLPFMRTPAGRDNIGYSPVLVTLARMLRWMLPHFPVGALDLSTACSCPKNLKHMLDDPLRWHGNCKAGFGACLIDATMEIQSKIPSIKFPFLMLQGEDDKLCHSKGAEMMYQKAASKDKTIKLYPKAFHCLLLEPNGIAEQVTEDIVQWLIARA